MKGALKAFRCYLTIASPGSLCNLHDALEAARQFTTGFSRLWFNDLAQTFNIIEHMEATNVVKQVVRRFALMRICTRRNEIVTSRDFSRTGRAQSEGLNRLTQESFPANTTPIPPLFEKKREEISNQLEWVARWLAIQQHFSDGVVALVCTTGVYAVQNCR